MSVRNKLKERGSKIMNRLKPSKLVGSLKTIGHASASSSDMFEKGIHNKEATKKAINQHIKNPILRGTAHLANHVHSTVAAVPGARKVWKATRNVALHTTHGLSQRFNRHAAKSGDVNSIRHQVVRQYIFDDIDSNNSNADKNSEVTYFLKYVNKNMETTMSLTMMANLFNMLNAASAVQNNQSNTSQKTNTQIAKLHGHYKDTVKQMLHLNGYALFTNVLTRMLEDIEKERLYYEKFKKLRQLQDMLPKSMRAEPVTINEQFYKEAPQRDKLVNYNKDAIGKIKKGLTLYNKHLKTILKEFSVDVLSEEHLITPGKTKNEVVTSILSGGFGNNIQRAKKTRKRASGKYAKKTKNHNSYKSKTIKRTLRNRTRKYKY